MHAPRLSSFTLEPSSLTSADMKSYSLFSKNKICAIALLAMFLFVGCKKPSEKPNPGEPSQPKYYVKRITFPDMPPIAGGDFLFRYDDANRVVEIQQKNVGTIKVEYNAEGLISKTISTGLFPGHTDYFYANKQLIKEIRFQTDSDPGGEIHTSKHTLEYVLGSVNKPIVIRSYNNADALRASAQIIYDEGGNPAKITSSSGIEYTYRFDKENYVLFPGNEGIYNCLENLIVFTSLLSYAVPPELNYRLPFSKQIKNITYRLPNGQTQLYSFSYQKNEHGLIKQLTANYGSGSASTVYTFEYEKR